MMSQEIEAGLRSPEKVRDEVRKRFLSGQGAAPIGYPAPGPAAPQAAPAPAASGGVVDYRTYFSGQ